MFEGNSSLIPVIAKHRGVRLGLWKATAVNNKLNLAPRVNSETETDSSKYVAKEYNRCTGKVKNTLKQEIYHFYFHLTHILEISRFEVPISRFFWAFFQCLQICMFWRLAGLSCRVHGLVRYVKEKRRCSVLECNRI